MNLDNELKNIVQITMEARKAQIKKDWENLPITKSTKLEFLEEVKQTIISAAKLGYSYAYIHIPENFFDNVDLNIYDFMFNEAIDVKASFVYHYLSGLSFSWEVE